MPKKPKSSSKYVTNSKDFISQKASERKRIKAPGNKETQEWKKWWLCDETKIGAATETIILKIENEQSLRFTSFVNWARLYGNWEAMTWGSNVLNNSTQDDNQDNLLRLNLIQSVIDAAAAKIAKDFPQPYFLTNGATSYFDKLKAEKMTKYCKGVMQQTKCQEKSVSQFRDAEVYGTGAKHWYLKDDEIKCDWVPTFELRVADYDGINKSPRSLHRVRMIAREELIAMFPEKEELITQIETNPTNRLRDSNNIVDMIRLKQSWHLPSSKKKKDGVYTATINDKCLVKEEYDLPFFPIPVFRWMDRPLGFYGRSVTEEVYSVQQSLDELLNVAAQSYSMVGMPIIFMPDGSEVPEDVILSNFIARLVPYRGNVAPQFATPEPLPASFFQWVGQHISWVFQIVGLSQTSATSQNQLGPDASGAAIRELVDIETSRFAQVSNAWEQNAINDARIIAALSKQASDKGVEMKATYTDNKQVSQFTFKDVELENFDIGCDVVSQAPDKVAGKVQTITEFVERQWISPEEAMEGYVLDPDLQEIVKVQTSSIRLTEKRLSEMVENGTPYLPEPYMLNLPKVLSLSQGIYNLLVSDNCPEDRLQLVRNWIDAVKVLVAPVPQAPPAQSAPAPDPNAPPMPQTAAPTQSAAQ